VLRDEERKRGDEYMNIVEDNRKKYEPLLESAEKEESAKGKCKWIVSILRMMTQNDLHYLYKGQCEIKSEMKRRMNKILVLVSLVLVVVLATNPQVGEITKKLMLILAAIW